MSFKKLTIYDVLVHRTSANGPSRENFVALHDSSTPGYKTTFNKFIITTLRFAFKIFLPLKSYSFMGLDPAVDGTPQLAPELASIIDEFQLFKQTESPNLAQLDSLVQRWAFALFTTSYLTKDRPSNPVGWFLISLTIALEAPTPWSGSHEPSPQMQAPGKLSNPYAHVQYSLRLVLWSKAVQILKNGQDPEIEALHPFADEDNDLYPIRSIRLAVSHSLKCTEDRAPAITELGRGDMLRVSNGKVVLTQQIMRDLASTLLTELENQLDNKLLFGLASHLQFGDGSQGLLDDFRETRSAYSFIRDPKNPFGQHFTTLF